MIKHMKAIARTATGRPCNTYSGQKLSTRGRGAYETTQRKRTGLEVILSEDKARANWNHILPAYKPVRITLLAGAKRHTAT